MAVKGATRRPSPMLKRFINLIALSMIACPLTDYLSRPLAFR